MSASSESSGPKLSIKFLVTNTFAGSLIGTQGNAIKELMEVSGSRVNVSGPTEVFPGSSDRVVLVIGNESSISSASALIWELVAIQNKAHDQSTRTATWSPRASFSTLGINDEIEVSLRLTVPASAGGLILGRGGITIRSIGETSGAKIQMTSKDDAIFTQERILSISGSLLACRKCTDLVVAKLAEDIEVAQFVNRGTTYTPTLRNMYGIIPPTNKPRVAGGSRRFGGASASNAPLSSLGSETAIAANTTIQLTVPDNVIGNILGKQGNTMREIMSLSGAKITISPRGEYAEGTTNRIVTITGTPLAAQTAHIFCTQKLQQGALNPKRSGGKRTEAL